MDPVVEVMCHKQVVLTVRNIVEDISAIAHCTDQAQPTQIEDAVGDSSGDQGAQHQRTGEHSNQCEQPGVMLDSIINIRLAKEKPVSTGRENAQHSHRENSLRRSLHPLAMSAAVK